MHNNSNIYKAKISAEAKRLGFAQTGFSKAAFLEEEAPRLEQWLAGNMHGQMQYMENWFDKRLDPRLLVPGAKTVVSLLLNYYPEKMQSVSAAKISKYAYGKDYHNVIKEKLKELIQFINDEIGEVNGRAFVDSAPVLDRAWAKKSGLGWIGKNANLINPKAGSFLFIAEMIIDLELEPDAPINDYCGTCNRCVDACPTEAITFPQIVDGSKCISYFTIELKDQIPEEYSNKMNDWIFGCDICQDVCPWNRFSKPTTEKDFIPNQYILNMTEKDWLEITEDVFDNIYKTSSLKRTGFNGMKRNVKFIGSPGEKPAQ
jgi:epoxyqueuosine reductase